MLSKLFKPNEQYIGWLEEVLNDIDRLQGQDNFSVTKTEVFLIILIIIIVICYLLFMYQLWLLFVNSTI